MKITLFIISIFIISFSSTAEEYKAPNVKLKKVDQSKLKVSVNKGNLDSGLSYKVEDKPINDRAVASDPEENKTEKAGRDPSSKTEVEFVTEDEVKMWKFEDIEDHP